MTNTDSRFYYPNRFIKSRPYLNRFITKINSRQDLSPYFDLIVSEVQRQSRLDPDLRFDQSRLNERMVTEVENIYSYAKFVKSGSNIFSFSKELLSMLDKTDVEEIQFENIKQPFKDYYVSFRELEKNLTGEYMDYEHKLDGAYISHEIDNVLIIHLTGYNDNKTSTNWYFHPDFSNINSLNFKSAHRTVKGALDNLQGELIKVAEKAPKELAPNIDRTFKEYSENIKLLINCLLFLSSQYNDSKRDYPSDTPGVLKAKLSKVNSKTQRATIDNELRNNGFTKINFLGSSFRDTKNADGHGDVATHWRRGHWRNQPFGQEMKERKLIWIQPTIVRADKGEPEKGHLYNVGE